MPTTTDTRLAHQLEVAQLLEELAEQRRRIHRLKAAGVQRAGMRELKHDFTGVRDRLAATLSNV